MLGALTALALLVGTLVPTLADARAPSRHLTSAEKAQSRQRLRDEVRRHPAKVFTKQFLRKASLVEFKLPLTVRLNPSDGQGGYLPSDDVLEIAWDDSTIMWPLTAPTVKAAPQLISLDGTFTMEADFGGDASGYGELGALETLTGRGIAMTADPFTISEFDPTCVSGPQIAGDPAHQVAVSSAGSRYGVMNMFSNVFRGSLALRMSFGSQIQSSCGGPVAVTSAPDQSAEAPMPVRMNGSFRLSPALTADGKMRLGRIVIDDSITPQTSTFAYVRACTNAVTPSCDPEQFPARLTVKKLTADVLLGSIRG